MLIIEQNILRQFKKNSAKRRPFNTSSRHKNPTAVFGPVSQKKSVGKLEEKKATEPIEKRKNMFKRTLNK